MQRIQRPAIRTWLRASALTALFLAAATATPRGHAVAEDAVSESPAYVVEISDVTAKVGERAEMRATLKVSDGYRILKAYNNRMYKLSSFDNGVTFDHEMVPAELQDRALVFAVGVQPTKPGKHPINGLFRVGYIHGDDEMAMVTVRLIANVTGTE